MLNLVFWVFIFVLGLSFFGISLEAIVNSPAGQENFSYVQEIMINVWNNYLKKPVMYLWKDIFLDLIWNPAINNLTKIRDGEPDSLRSSAPTIPNPQPIPN